jgi:hypothetical protein
MTHLEEKISKFLKVTSTASPYRTLKSCDGSHWFKFHKHEAYLGDTEPAAIVTATRGDWFLPFRDGYLTREIRDYFSRREAGDPFNQADQDRVMLNQLPSQLQDELVAEGVREMVFDREMDPGEFLTADDLSTLCDPGGEIEARVYLLYSVHSDKPLAKVRGTLKGFPTEDLFQIRDETFLVRSRLAVRPEGWRLTESDVLQIPARVKLILRAEVIVDPNTQNILNLRVFDIRGETVIHLIGDEDGGMIFENLNLENVG